MKALVVITFDSSSLGAVWVLDIMLKQNVAKQFVSVGDMILHIHRVVDVHGNRALTVLYRITFMMRWNGQKVARIGVWDDFRRTIQSVEIVFHVAGTVEVNIHGHVRQLTRREIPSMIELVNWIRLWGAVDGDRERFEVQIVGQVKYYDSDEIETYSYMEGWGRSVIALRDVRVSSPAEIIPHSYSSFIYCPSNFLAIPPHHKGNLVQHGQCLIPVDINNSPYVRNHVPNTRIIMQKKCEDIFQTSSHHPKIFPHQINVITTPLAIYNGAAGTRLSVMPASSASSFPLCKTCFGGANHPLFLLRHRPSLNMALHISMTERITRGLYTPVFLNAWELRAREPDHIPVSVGKDASSDIPDIDMTKYNVHRDMPLKEFVDFIRLRIQHDFPWKKSMFVYFKNTEPPIGEHSCITFLL
ncbi:hypothetical protein C1H46_038890 [Malus baccata]|uniref:Uncharacterized protein n=1 Tax=Malus baccata TaxID=106549 RepID=A0A540KN02_MALBA|nr:hypothetical protein C1H46_038890 [Malus baccata]